MRRFLALCFLLLFTTMAHADEHPDWTTPLSPFKLADGLYYVGSRDLASYLITTPKGNILINANLESSPKLIRASVERLGFRWTDTRILLSGQSHFDHAAGLAEIERETRAKNMAMEGDADVIASGGRTDFLYPSSNVPTYPPAYVNRVLHDGETVTLGGVTLTAHKTPGHTRGCTTWTFPVHLSGEPAGSHRDVVIVGGVSFWSEFHFVATSGHPASYPGIAEDFSQTFATLHKLHCDIFLGAHGVYFSLLSKQARLASEGQSVFVDSAGYQAFVASGQAAFENALNKQRADVVH